MKKSLRMVLELSKVRITISVALTTLAGYILARGRFDLGFIAPVLGIFFLASASAAMNHFQDADRDAMMRRTRLRPIPSGRISKTGTLFVVLALALCGSFLLWIKPGMPGLLLGWLAFFWYNGIYTPLKRMTAFAVIPGSVIGSIPPMVGWIAAGGSLADPRLIIPAIFYFIWQVPHFWLLMIHYGKEYPEAGYPSVTEVFSPEKFKLHIFFWVVAAAISAILLPMSRLINSVWTSIAIVVAALWIVIAFVGLLSKAKRNTPLNPFYYFMRINYFVLSVTLAILIDPLI